MRGSGVLLHISSLPSKYGIGTLGERAYDFVDFLVKAGQTYWQILPIGPTGYGDSPYQSFSTFAGNPYFIDFDLLEWDGSLNKSDYANIDWGDNPKEVDYEKIFNNKYKVLKIAFDNSYSRKKQEIREFREKNAYWIEDYAFYMALKFEFGLQPYKYWENDIKLRKPESMLEYSEALKREIEFWIYVQYEFFKQWNRLKGYANDKRIKIIGDIPIYVAEDSADAWANSEILDLDENRIPVMVSGCPPDAFSELGQLWGNPVYRWDVLKYTGYEWWIKRIDHALKIYDVVRIDHFRGFDTYYTIPHGSKDATLGKWEKGPGLEFFEVLKSELGNIPVIAEDLGELFESTKTMLKESGYPGMRVMEFAFGTEEDSVYLPHNYIKNCIAYIGTHDNATLLGWLEGQPEGVLDFVKNYVRAGDYEDINWSFIKTVFSSCADTVIIQMQDLVGLGSDSRMNTPSTNYGNWNFKISDSYFSDEISSKLLMITKTYKRVEKD